MNSRLLLCDLLLLFLFLGCLVPRFSLAAAIPQQRLSISFSVHDSLLNGTSQIVIPPESALQLNFGPLKITGTVLDQLGKSPRSVNVPKNNTFSVPFAKEEQILTVSWQLHVAAGGEDDNIISPEGITLAGFWHPVAEVDMLYSLEARVPRHFEAISEADIVHAEFSAGEKLVTTTFAQPLNRLHFAAGPYRVESKQLPNVTLSSFFFHEDAALAKGFLEKTAELINRYQSLIGPFPYKRFAIVENRLPTGYGLPTFTLLGQTVIRLPFVKERSLGHEILHSWFGNSVSIDAGSGNWTEGLTTSLADQSFAEESRNGASFRKTQMIDYHAYVHPQNAIPLTAFHNTGDNRPIGRALRAVGYDKSAMLFHMLRHHIGASAFQVGVRRLYETKRNQKASWQDIETIFSQSSGKDLHPFFHQWLERSDLPSVTTKNAKIDQRDGRAVLTFELIQNTPTPYLLDIPIRVRTLRGETIKTATTDTAEKAITFELDSLPTQLVIDDQYDLMRQLDPAELPPTWSQLLGAEQKMVLAPPDTALTVYQPVIEALQQAGCRIVSSGAATNSALAQGSWLFLGDSPQRRSLFAEPAAPSDGFTVDVRRSPLNVNEVAVLVDSSSAEESKTAIGKLAHYGPYSRLSFKEGRNREKSTAASAEGIVLSLIDKPQGMPVQATRNFEQIIGDLARAKVVYVGETHTEYTSHMLQLQILQALHAGNKRLAVGLEMFPRSSQRTLDAYIQGTIDERTFLKTSNYFEVWGYDYRLYRDIFAYARAQRIPLIGLNLDKEISKQVFATGSTDGLTSAQQKQIALDRNLDSPGYQQRLQTVFSQHNAPHGGGVTGFLQAQALWDETMAESIVTTSKRFPDHQILVLAGNGHVGKDNGIPPRVARREPNYSQRIVTVADTVETDRDQYDYLMFAHPIALVPAGKLGITFKEVASGENSGQLEVKGISPHGLAGKAGIKEGDRLLALDGQPLEDVADIRISLLDKKAGDTVLLQLVRGREKLTVPVELSALEPLTVMPASHPKP